MLFASIGLGDFATIYISIASTSPVNDDYSTFKLLFQNILKSAILL